MLAPSEKHLEDYLWAHPEALGTYWIPSDPNTDLCMYKFAFRQYRTLAGIIDLIGFDGASVCVIELKRDLITARALTQVMRYVRDMEAVMKRLQHEMGKNPVFHNWLSQNFEDYRLPENMVHGTLIGNGVEDDNLLIACAACNVDVFTYDYNPDSQTCRFAEIPLEKSSFAQINPVIEQAVFGELGRTIIDFYAEEIRACNTPRFSAINAATAYIDSLDKHDDTGGES